MSAIMGGVSNLHTMATFTMVMAESAIIDSDHWRHVFLLIGLIWGLSTAVSNDRRRTVPRDKMLI